MKKSHFVYLFFSLLIAGLVQVPSMSWAQDTVTPPELEEDAGETFQELQKNNPGQLKKRPRALQQRRENRQDRRQDFRENRRDNRQDRRQDVRENRQDRKQDVRENRRDHTKVRPKALKQRRENRQDRRQDFRSNRQGGDQRKGGNRGGGGRGRR